jgi:hypothetical protein
MLTIRDWGPQPTRPWETAPSYAFWPEIDHDDFRATTTSLSSEDVETVTSESAQWIQPDQDVSRILVDLFKKVRQVKSICVQFGPEEIMVWTLLKTYDRKARERVYKKEMEVCRVLGVRDFEFRVTSFDLVSPEELIRNGSREIYRRD